VIEKLLGCHYNDVSLSEKTLSQVDCTIAVCFVFVDIAVFVTGFTRLLVQPRAAGRLLNYSQMILEPDLGLVGLAEWK